MSMHQLRQTICSILFLSLALHAPLSAQQILGAITGTVMDSSGAAVADAAVKAVNVATNLEVNANTRKRTVRIRSRISPPELTSSLSPRQDSKPKPTPKFW